ncbi:FHA domain-containing protein [bacterium]|nr:FHA domain-containing protein [bacterium]
MPELIITLNGEEIGHHSFSGGEVSIGRGDGSDILLENLSVSRRHARISIEDGRYFLTDLESANGTYVNATRVTRAQIFHDDRIIVGKHVLVFQEPQAQPADFDPEGARTILVMPPSSGPCLGVESTGFSKEPAPLRPGVTLIGRGEDCHIRLSDWFVEMHQAEIERSGDTFILRDISPRSTTYVNGEPVVEHVLWDGDVIDMGVSRLVFLAEAGETADDDLLFKPSAAKEKTDPEAEQESERIGMTDELAEVLALEGAAKALPDEEPDLGESLDSSASPEEVVASGEWHELEGEQREPASDESREQESSQ